MKDDIKNHKQANAEMEADETILKTLTQEELQKMSEEVKKIKQKLRQEEDAQEEEMAKQEDEIAKYEYEVKLLRLWVKEKKQEQALGTLKTKELKR